MKILVIGDTHGKIRHVVDLIHDLKDIDRIIHLGDLVGDAKFLEKQFTGIPIDYVRGNCDFLDFDTPEDKTILAVGKRIWLTHGHLYHVKRNYNLIGIQAMENEADIALFGHTHAGYIGHYEDIWLMNPGSVSEPRDRGMPSFGIIEINADGKIHPTINRIK